MFLIVVGAGDNIVQSQNGFDINSNGDLINIVIAEDKPSDPHVCIISYSESHVVYGHLCIPSDALIDDIEMMSDNFIAVAGRSSNGLDLIYVSYLESHCL